jgi:hypothetical protein
MSASGLSAQARNVGFRDASQFRFPTEAVEKRASVRLLSGGMVRRPVLRSQLVFS